MVHGNTCLPQPPLPGHPRGKQQGPMPCWERSLPGTAGCSGARARAPLCDTSPSCTWLNCCLLMPALWSSSLCFGGYCCEQACASHAWLCAGVFNEGRASHAATMMFRSCHTDGCILMWSASFPDLRSHVGYQTQSCVRAAFL